MSDSQENTESCKLRAYQRNNYYYGKLMTVRDFELEQQYLNDKRWLVNRLMFGSGTVCGLRVESQGMNVIIRSGLAIDRCGREIVVPEDVSLILSETDKPSLQNKKAIYIKYNECPKERVRAQTASTCKEVCANNRTEESYTYEIETIQDNGVEISDGKICGIWNNLSTKIFNYRSGDGQIRISRKVKNYVTPQDIFEVHLSITNISDSSVSVSLSETLPPGLTLIDGINDPGTISIQSRDTINIWYLVRAESGQAGNFVIKTNINGLEYDETSSIIEVKSPHEISESLQKNLIEFWTEPCFDINKDTRVKIAELSLGTDGSGNPKLIADNTKRTLVNNNKYITQMLECLKTQASELEDQSTYLKNKIAPSKILLSVNPDEIYANGNAVSEITITVQDDAGAGLSGIDVMLISTLGSIPDHVTTGQNGIVKATLRSGTIPGIAAVMATTGSGAAVTQVTFKPTTGSIEGFVNDITDDTKKIKEATVSVGTITTVTDDEGHYLLQNVPHGNQVVWAFASGYEKASDLVNVKPDQANKMDIPLTPISTEGIITGRVLDIDGNVIQKIVKVMAGGISTTADETGNYTLSNVPTGTYTVTASADDYQTKSRGSVVVTDDQTTSGINFMLEHATGIIKGRVTEISGIRPADLLVETGHVTREISAIPRILPGGIMPRPVSRGIMGATISVVGTSLSALTDESGNYVLYNVPLGTHTVTASAPDYNAQTSSVLVEANMTLTLNFQLLALVTTGTVSGRVTTFRKLIRPICTGATPQITRIPADIPAVRPISTTVARPLGTTAARSPDTAVVRPVDMTIARPLDTDTATSAAASLCIAGRPGDTPCIAGRPGDIPCLAGVPDSNMEEIGIQGATVSVAGLSAITDSLGNYIIRNVPEGSQDVVANAAGYVTGKSTVNVPAGGTVTANFRLTVAVSKGTISGRVTTARDNIRTDASPVPVSTAIGICSAGRPGITGVTGIKGATVSVTGTSLSAVTDDSGNYSIPDIPTGSYTVIASAPGYSTGTQKPLVNENQTTILNFQLNRVICAAGQPDVPCPAGQPRIICTAGSPLITCMAGKPDNIISCVAGKPDNIIVTPCTSARPIIDRPVVDRPVVDRPVVDRPVVDRPVVDRPVVDRPVVDRPVDRPVVDRPVDRPVVDRPVVDRPVVDRPVVDRPVVDRPVVDRPVVDRPVVDRPVVDRPVVDRLVVDRPVVDRSDTVTPVPRSVSDTSDATTTCPAGRPTISPIRKPRPR
ncbi:MAG: carboxypeptidase regulatory-like domain-containing protein [Candidatus Methanoperedens sp.]|nr:carboxypeptidase regulatory-like domain-containing protein [Candidatus Methanoperedens sp.]